MGKYDLPQGRSQWANLPQVVGHMVRGGAISPSIVGNSHGGAATHLEPTPQPEVSTARGQEKFHRKCCRGEGVIV